MPTRREFLRAGGLTLAGLGLPRWLGGRPGSSAGRAPFPAELERRTVEIRMQSDGSGSRVWFDPIGVRLTPGTTVRWILEANVHSTTAYHPANGGFARRIPARAEPWDSGLLTRPGQSFTRNFDVPGVYDYYCIPHELAGMVGRIVVLSPGHPASDPREPGPPADGLRSPSGAALEAFPSIARIVREGVVRGA